jgi:hypothetical protein
MHEILNTQNACQNTNISPVAQAVADIEIEMHRNETINQGAERFPYMSFDSLPHVFLLP